MEEDRRSIVDNHESLTVDEVLTNLKFGWFQFRLAAITSIFMLSDGLEATILSVVGPVLLCAWKLTKIELSILSSAVFGGTVVGSILVGKLADLYGRRKTIVLCSLFVFIFGFISSVSPNFTLLVISRCLFGIFLSSFYAAINLLLEFTPVDLRARVSSMAGVAFSTGMFLGTLLGWIVLRYYSWRAVLLTATVPTIISFLFLTKWCPESLRFLSLRGDNQQLLALIGQIAKMNGKTMPTAHIVLHKTAERGSYVDLFNSRYVRTTVPLLTSTFLALMCSYGMVFLQPLMLHHMNKQEEEEGCILSCIALSSDDFKSLLLTGAIETSGLLFVPYVWNSRLGRKKSTALLNCIASIFVLCLTFSKQSMLITTFLFCVIRGILQSSTFVYLLLATESFPTRIRGVGTGICGGFNKLGTFVAPLIGQGIYLYSADLAIGIFCISLVLSSITVLLIPKETANCSLADTDCD
ncbi:Uncharacterised protein g6247 [Pycnogonum litorale]